MTNYVCMYRKPSNTRDEALHIKNQRTDKLNNLIEENLPKNFGQI